MNELNIDINIDGFQLIVVGFFVVCIVVAIVTTLR